MGGVLGFAFECFEKGLITAADTGGVELRWGDHRAMLAVIEMVAHRRHIGDLLAEGVMRAAARMGRGAEALAMHVGGQELPFHDPKVTPSYATTYLTDPTPGRHTAGGAYVQESTYQMVPFAVDVPKVRRFDYAGKGPAHAIMTQTKQIQQATGMCEFSMVVDTFPFEIMIKGATGWELTAQDLLTIGDRIQTLRQAFNAREGLKPADWQLPGRVVGSPAHTTGPAAGITLDVAAMARGYYEAMEIDPATGRPSAAKLRRLGLERAAAELWGQAPASAAGDD